MKIDQSKNQGEKRTLSSFLVNFCDTPHTATGASFQMDAGVTYRINHYLIRNQILPELETRIKKLIERVFTIHAF